MPDNIHDKFFKEIFAHTGRASVLLQTVLPALLAEQLDWSALEPANGSFVDEQLQEHFADLIFTCPYRGQAPVEIALLLEHKSYREKYPHWQLLRYLLNGWEADRKQKRPPVLRIPVIIYHGVTHWPNEPMSSYFPGIDPPLLPYLPDFQYHLLDLSIWPDEQITSFKDRFVETALFLMKHRHDETFLLANAPRLFFWLEEEIESREGENFFRTTLVYLASVTDFSRRQLVDKLFSNTPINPNAMTVLDAWIQEGIEKGMALGIERGMQQGMQQATTKLVKRLYPKVQDLQLLAEATDLSIDQVKAILAQPDGDRS